MSYESVIRAGRALLVRIGLLQTEVDKCNECGEILCEYHSEMLNEINFECEELWEESPMLLEEPTGLLN